MNIKISEHAIERYRERIGPLPKGAALSRLALFERLNEAKPKHIRKIGKRTAMVPLSDCLLVFEGASMVTVLERKPA